MLPKKRFPRNEDGTVAPLKPAEKRALLAEIKAEIYPPRDKPLRRGAPTKDNPKGPVLDWAKLPPKPRPTQRRAKPSGRVPNKDEGRTALERLSKLGGSTTYRVPQAGRSTKIGNGNEALTGCLGYVQDDLQQRMALALSVHTVAEWKDIEELAAAPLLKQLLGSHKTRKLVMGDKRHRARLILEEVFFDIAMPRIPRATRDAAQALKMSQRDYRTLYQSTAGYLESEAHMGAIEAIESIYLDARRPQ